MSANITSDKTKEVRHYTRRIEFDNISPIRLERRYSHGGKEFLPDTAFARWNHGGLINSITVSGAVLKKDGTPGTVRTDLTYDAPGSNAWSTRWGINAPAWLLEAFQIEIPTEMSI